MLTEREVSELITEVSTDVEVFWRRSLSTDGRPTPCLRAVIAVAVQRYLVRAGHIERVRAGEGK